MRDLSIDVETTKAPNHYPWNGALVSVAICLKGGDTYTWLFNHPDAKKTPRKCIDEIQHFIDSADRIIAHNLKFDLIWLLSIGIDVSGKLLYCTQVAEYILSGQSLVGQLSLDVVSRSYGITPKIDKVKLYWDSGYDTHEIPSEILIPYGEQDVINALAIAIRQYPRIQEQGMVGIISLEMETVRVLANVEIEGMCVSAEQLQGYSDDYAAQLVDIDSELYQLIGQCNFDSNDQLSVALFGGTVKVKEQVWVERTLKSGEVKKYQRWEEVEIVKEGAGFTPVAGSELKKAGFYSTSAEYLKQLKCKTKEQKRIIELILSRAKIQKLKSTYFDGLLTKIQPDGKVHPSMNQTIAVTTRLTSSNPNGQNLPRGSTGPAKKPFITRYKE